MKYSLPKGTFDILPKEPKPQDSWKESAKWNHLETVIRTLAQEYGYLEIRTPIFELTDQKRRKNFRFESMIEQGVFLQPKHI